jgi:hypothetical protein
LVYIDISLYECVCLTRHEVNATSSHELLTCRVFPFCSVSVLLPVPTVEDLVGLEAKDLVVAGTILTIARAWTLMKRFNALPPGRVPPAQALLHKTPAPRPEAPVSPVVRVLPPVLFGVPPSVKCRHGHPLTVVSGKPLRYKDWQCDECRHKIPVATVGVWHCAVCQYDVCLPCQPTITAVRAFKFPIRGAPAIAAATAAAAAAAAAAVPASPVRAALPFFRVPGPRRPDVWPAVPIRHEPADHLGDLEELARAVIVRQYVHLCKVGAVGAVRVLLTSYSRSHLH